MSRRIKFIKKTTSEEQTEQQKKSNSKNVHFAETLVKTTSLKHNHTSTSILKKQRSTTPMQNHRIRSGSMNSLAGHSSKEDQTCQNFVLNKVVKQQYNKLIQKHSTKLKFTDQIFPPNISSLFSYSNRKSHKQCTIKWKRLSEIFPERDLIIMGHDPLKNFIKPSTKMCSQYFCLSLNCLKNNRPLLKKIFELCKVNQSGIYCLKIFQTNLWKYIIVDDLIPVVQETDKKGTKYTPAFAIGQFGFNKTQPIQIWPYLFEKAYAKYYSSYEALQVGNVFDFLQEISNQNYHEINFQNNHLNLKEIFKQPEIMIVGEDKSGKYTPLFSSIGLSQKVFYLSSQKPGYKHHLRPQELQTNFNYLYIFGLIKYPYVGFCPVKQAKQSISIRTFELKKPGKCALSLVQKEQRFFNSKIPYKYSWIRVILLEKQVNEGFRFIDGRYQNYKSIFMEVNLEKGLFYVVIMPQWNNRPYDLTLLLKTKMPTQMERKQYEDSIVEDGCADMAQRFGQINQINHYICSYNCIHEDLGLIIQNINNEKMVGGIKIVRTMDGLQAQLPIEPFNKQFRDKNTLQVTIKNNSHYTVVLMMRGGVDRNFFQTFDFGV